MSIRRSFTAAVVSALALASTPALAWEPDYALSPEEYLPEGTVIYQGEWNGGWQTPNQYEGQWTGQYRQAAPQGLPPQPASVQRGYSEDERDAWLKECRKRYSDDGLGGALIGGVLGGFAGNRIAGKGNRTVGTIAGAAVGAVAGAAIDKAEDAPRVRDECESYLLRYEAGYGAGYPQAATYAQPGPPPYGQPSYGYAPVMWVPTIVGWKCKTKKQPVVEEVAPRPARRVIPKPDKRLKMTPVKGDKRLPMSQKTTKTTK